LAAAAAQTGATAKHSAYRDVMNIQYAARAPAVAQQPDEAKRIYEAYLNSLGQKANNTAGQASGASENQPR
jgi:hypothetical protein